MRFILPKVLLLLLTSLSIATTKSVNPLTNTSPRLILIPPGIAAPSTISASTTATLTTIGQRTYRAPILRSNVFIFRNLTAGSYLLSIHCPEWVFASYRVDVAGMGGSVEVYRTLMGNAWGDKGELKGRWVAEEGGGGAGKKRDVKIELDVLGRKEYYSAREGFSPLSLLKSPMILLALVSMVIVFGMPYMLDNMDPEMRKEFEEQQRNNPLTGAAASAAANPLQGFDVAGWMAGKSTTTGSNGGSGGSSSSTTTGATRAETQRDEGSGQGQGQGKGVRRRG